ncbi:ankyrin repeat domain-containing protein [Marinobacter sp. GN3S48]|uniref:ankyrin repeat domain-containing protein n=1 Tax=Marinobacter sp. GN3S48 TaxID=3382302 RepID=UPI00387A9F22
MKRSRLEAIFHRHQIDSNDEPWDVENLDKQMADRDAIIHWVARYGTAEDLSTLIDAGASINIRGDIGRNPLLEAVAFNKPENAKILIQAGANVSDVDDFGDSILDLVSEENVELCEVVHKSV